ARADVAQGKSRYGRGGRTAGVSFSNHSTWEGEVMRRTFALCMAGAITLALTGSAFAIAVPSTTTQLCSDKLQNEGLLYVNALQKQVRLSIQNNIKQTHFKFSKGTIFCSRRVNHPAPFPDT